MKKTHIIAEMATNYFDSDYLAEQSIKKAAYAGADSVKIQIMVPSETYLDGIYKYGHYKIQDVRKLRELAYLPNNRLIKLKKISKKYKIELTASVFGLESLNKASILQPLYYKIASGDLNNKELIEAAIKKKRKVIISTGMCTEKEIKRTIDLLKKRKFSNFVIMHCVAEYPHKTESSQLGFLKKLNNFGIETGFSDHSLNSSAAVVAVSLGAKWIEKHFTLSKDLGGLDAKHSLEPEELKNYVDEIRGIEKSLEKKNRIVTKAENYTMQRARRSIFVKKKLKKNHKIGRDDLLIVRPYKGKDIWEVDKFIGKKLKINLNKNKIIKAKYLK